MKSIYQTATFVCQVGLPVENSVHHKKKCCSYPPRTHLSVSTDRVCSSKQWHNGCVW